MARPKSSNPRSEQLLMRLTEGQMRVLEAVAHLEGQTPNTYARGLLETHLKALEQHPRVRADIENRKRYEAEKSQTVVLHRQDRHGGSPAEAGVQGDRDASTAGDQ